jgi:hypothetical protein
MLCELDRIRFSKHDHAGLLCTVCTTCSNATRSRLVSRVVHADVRGKSLKTMLVPKLVEEIFVY